MSTRNTIHNNMRIWHRYLGFFLAGIMAVYALSGIALIFRDTDFLKQKKTITKQLAPNLSAEELGKAIKIRDLKVASVQGEFLQFKLRLSNIKKLCFSFGYHWSTFFYFRICNLGLQSVYPLFKNCM